MIENGEYKFRRRKNGKGWRILSEDSESLLCALSVCTCESCREWKALIGRKRFGIKPGESCIITVSGE